MPLDLTSTPNSSARALTSRPDRSLPSCQGSDEWPSLGDGMVAWSTLGAREWGQVDGTEMYFRGTLSRIWGRFRLQQWQAMVDMWWLRRRRGLRVRGNSQKFLDGATVWTKVHSSQSGRLGKLGWNIKSLVLEMQSSGCLENHGGRDGNSYKRRQGGDGDFCEPDLATIMLFWWENGTQIQNTWFNEYTLEHNYLEAGGSCMCLSQGLIWVVKRE